MNCKKLLSYFLIICNLILPSVLSAAPTFQYENKLIEKINIIIMNSAEGCEDQSNICGRMKTRQGDLFSQADFDADLKKLSQDFDRVEPEINCGSESMQVTLKIWPKPIIRSIHWKGNEKIRTKKLKYELEIRPGQVFDRLEFNTAFHKLKAFYIKNGFFEAQLEYVVNIDPNCNEVDVDIIINEGRAGKIKEIRFVNFASCEENELLELMATKTYNFFLSWFTGEGVYNEEAVQQDQFNIINYLHNRGFADARVKIEVCESAQDDRIILIITLDRGPLYTFGNITIEGNKLYTNEQILSHFTFCQGDPFSPEEVRRTIRDLTDVYGRKGYIDAVIDFVPTINCETLSYDVKLMIEEDEQYYVGLIKVFGNCSTQTNVILHETLLIPGELFNIDKLQKTEERLTNIGYFKTVNVYAVKSEDCCLEGNFRDVHIEVEETSTGSFGAFLGYSTVESLFCGLNVTEKNFNYKGLGCFWRDGFHVLRGGGEYVHLTASVGTKSRKYVFSWTKPYFMDTQWAVGFDVERSCNRYISDDYVINANGFTLHGTYVYNSFVKYGLHYRIRGTDVDVSRHADKELREDAHNTGIISAVGVSFMYDATDHPALPTCGFRSRFDVEYAGLGGKCHFLGTSYLNSYYIPVEKGVLKFRGDVRFIQPLENTSFDELPIDERLFLGGDYTIRGFRSYRLGPHYGKDKGDPKGGISMQLLSVEFSRPLFKRIEGFVYTDAGHLSDETWHIGRMSIASGVGLRVKVMDCIPPLTVGIGYPWNPRSSGEVKKFFMTVGGRF